MSSFPGVIYGNYGDEKVNSTNAIGGLPIGQLMILPDGRKYRQTRLSATAGVAGQLYQQNSFAVVAGSADAGFTASLSAGTAAAGSTTVTLTTGATAVVTTNMFKDGYLFVATSAGQGLTYKIKSCGSAAAGSTLTVTLYETDEIKVAAAASSTKFGLRQNEYDNITVNTADTVGVGPLAGVLAASAAASSYCWVQRSGPCAVLTDATTPIVGIGVTASSTVAGAIGKVNITAADTAGTQVLKGNHPIGWAMNVAASASYTLIHLNLE